MAARAVVFGLLGAFAHSSERPFIFATLRRIVRESLAAGGLRHRVRLMQQAEGDAFGSRGRRPMR
jgi:hypothetical protein